MPGLFPCSWNLPGKKPVKDLAEHHFNPKTLRISAPAPEPIKIAIPECELCVGEQNDFSEVDRMLADLNDDSQDAKDRRMMSMIQMVNENLDKNIKAIKNAPASENDNVSRDEILKLLKLFANFVHTIENYFKETQCCR